MRARRGAVSGNTLAGARNASPAARFQTACPGVGLTLRTAPFSEGVQLLEGGASDLHCGGIDGGQPLPAHLRREPLFKVTAGIAE